MPEQIPAEPGAASAPPDAEWEAWQKALQGTLLRPGQPDYERARLDVVSHGTPVAVEVERLRDPAQPATVQEQAHPQ